MRYDGIIKTWNDERGFGFIEPARGGQEIFVHIKAFSKLRERPQAEQRVTFEVESGPEGKKRATRVEVVRTRSAASVPRRDSPAQWGTATLFVIPVFFAVVLLAHFLGNPPRWSFAFYFVASLVTFLAYAWDKAAAQKGAWRTSEGTLHMLGLLGGWPGALLAQQFLRHKSVKAAFRATFWVTVLINVAAFLALASGLVNVGL